MVSKRSASPTRGTPASIAELRKLFGVGGAAQGRLYDHLYYSAFTDVHLLKDDFDGDTINLDNWAVANSGGAGVVNVAVPATPIFPGAARGETGTTSDGSLSMIGPLIYKGNNNAGMQARFKIDAVTALNFEVGFIDAVPAANASGVSDIDTPAFTAADIAVLALDTSQTLTTMAFGTKGSTAGQTATATTLASPAPTLPTAATYLTVRIQLLGNNAYCWVNGFLAATHNTIAAGHVEGATLLAPWVYVRTRNTTTKKFDIDYVACWQERS